MTNKIINMDSGKGTHTPTEGQLSTQDGNPESICPRCGARLSEGKWVLQGLSEEEQMKEGVCPAYSYDSISQKATM